MRDFESESQSGIHISQDMYFVFSTDGKFLDYQTKDPSLVLIPPEKFMNKYYYEVFPESLIQIFKEAFERVNSTGEFQTIAYTLTINDEQKFQEALLIPSEKDRIIAVIKDITRSKELNKLFEANKEFSTRLIDNITRTITGINLPDASKFTPAEYLMTLGNLPVEEREKFVWKLLNSEDRFRTIFENSPIAIAIGIKGKFLQVNKAYAKIYGFEDPSELPGTSIYNRIAPEDRVHAESYMKANAEGKLTFISADQYGVKKDGTLFPIHTDITSMRIFEGNAVIAFISDMTEIVNREERIKASLKEKEIMLKEIHHRVKNNLQIISSMLSLQSDLINDENYMSAFNDSRDRVRTMAIIHEKLYQSRNFSSIDFGEYAIELINYLYKTYWTESEQIAIRYDLDPVFLTIELAIPCGLILNELVSNAFKYAFRPPKKGILKFSFKADGTSVTMRIKDNGPGIPEERNTDNSNTLGLMMVRTLSQQLNGNIELKNRNGAEFTIKFKNESSH